MRRLARLVVVATIAGGTVLGSAPAAVAGGPTSVLLVSPNSGRTASLYVTDHRYAELQQALDERATVDRDAPDVHDAPADVNVTWLVHDVSAWRVDRVFVDVDGDAWVETRISHDAPIAGQRGTVHQAGDPALLLGLLDRLGLLNSGTTSNGSAVAARSATAGARFEWLWLVVGLAAGVVLGAGARPAVHLLSRFRRTAPGFSG